MNKDLPGFFSFSGTIQERYGLSGRYPAGSSTGTRLYSNIKNATALALDPGIDRCAWDAVDECRL